MTLGFSQKLFNLCSWMPFRSCAICERVLFAQTWLCEVCLLQLQSYAKPQLGALSVSSAKKVPHMYLWLSRHENGALLTRYILSLKGGAPPWASHDWVAKWVNSAKVSFSPQALLVPAPPKLLGCRDHAHQLCEEISKLRNLEIRCLLQRSPSERSQKSASRRERRRLALLYMGSEEDKRDLRSRDVHFIDDVVTTGSTAAATWRALGRPRRFYVWSLIYRSRLIP